MSVAVDAGLADGDGGVSPKHQLTPRPLRSSRVSPPPVPPASATVTNPAGTTAGAASHEDGEEADETGHHRTSAGHEAAAPEPFPSMSSPNIGRNGGLSSYGLRTDPDAQATVTDFLDFTEYLPSDMARTLTLIGKLDDNYIESSTKVHQLTDLWGQLPNTPAGARPAPAQLRAEISANLDQGLSARVYSHAEALRMAENVNRHYFRAKTILSKLRTMLENYPEAEQQQQEQLQQKQQQQQQQREQEEQLQSQPAKLKKSNGQQRMRRQRVPRITVPGEVLAPYDLDYESYTGESDISSPSSEDDSPPPNTMRRKSTPAAQPRIKGLKGAAGGRVAGVNGSLHGLKVPKVRVPRESRVPGQPYISTSTALARLKPPPENAVIGSADAPWLQLTAYELARLRKRMKKNAQWSPSETMIARELKVLGRNLEAFNQARKKAEAEGRVFEGILPDPALEAGALSIEAAVAAEDNQLSNRGIKLNEAKKLKNDLGQLAAQEAEESTRRMMEAARAIFSPYPGAGAGAGAGTTPDAAAIASGSLSARATTPAVGAASGAAASRKRKREVPAVEVADTVEGADNGVGEAVTPLPASQRQLQKRVKTETPVPIPQPAMGSAPPHDVNSSSNNNNNNNNNNGLATPAHPPRTRHSMTPVPAPILGQQPSNTGATSQDPNTNAASRQSTAMSSPLSSGTSNQSGTGYAGPAATTTTTVPLKPPAETPIHPPVHKSTTPIHPPVRELRTREPVRKDLPLHPASEDADDLAVPARTSRASSRALTPNPVNALGIVNAVLPTTEPGASTTTLATAGPTTTMARRLSSRGASAAAPNTEGQSLAVERPRRASTARNTPVPDALRQAGATGGKRVKRPAPGVVSRTSSGGSAAVGPRKAAPRKKKRGSNAHNGSNSNSNSNSNQQRRDSRGKSTDGDEVEVDDDGNVIDANEPRYCVCNRVSFGTMIQCDNIDEWFHLECVGMTAVPARTTKWYCPDCRVLLNIGEKGEVSARGVKM